jgi:hypothetical protein
VLIVKEAQAKHNFGGKGYLSFEHITWVKDLQNYTMIAVFRHIHWVLTVLVGHYTIHGYKL